MQKTQRATAIAGWGLGVALTLSVMAGTAQAQSGPPEWFVQEMGRMVNDGDRWIADNSPFVSDQEPWTAYGMEWHWAMDGIAIAGRLFGILNDNEPTFWDFRMYWDAGAKQAMMVQIGGDGRVGEGAMRATGKGDETEADQTFRLPDGSTMRVRHLSTTTADTHTTTSFDWVNGQWEQRRTYVWKRTKHAMR